MAAKLTGGKKLRQSKTVRSNVYSILATLGTVAAVLGGGAEPTVAIPAVASAAVSIWGNLMSIVHRKKATEVIEK